MTLEEKIEEAVAQASMLDGSPAVKGGGLGAAYVGKSIGSDQWCAKADWSNEFGVFAHGKTPEEALANLIRKLLEM